MKTKDLKMKVKLGRWELKVPIVCASGTFGMGSELKGLADFKKIGAIIAKTITLLPHAGNIPPRIFETECGIINSIGLENPGVEAFIKKRVSNLGKINTKLIVSVGGFSQEEYQEVVKKLDKIKDVEALEINFSCPNTELKKMISQDYKLTYKVMKTLRGLTKKILIAKISPEVGDITLAAGAVKDAGADALSLVNTFFALAINTQTRKPYLGNIYGGYSGRAIKPLSLYRVWQVHKKIDIPIIGGGGIEKASDAIEFILAGATAVSLGTVNLVNPNSASVILGEIKEYMIKNRINDINQLRGGLIV